MRALTFISGLLLLGSHTAVAQNAADAFFDPQEMAAARASLKESHGNQINRWIIAERLEQQFKDDSEPLVWEAQGWLGTDTDKLWFKTEGEREGGDTEEAELQLLYSRAVSPFWDLQAGLRHDFSPSPDRTYLALGIQGLAPYWFEMDTAIFLSEKGNISARVEAEYELFLTQRLILQPRLELNYAASDDDALGLNSGLFDTVAELRLRYEVRRQFAPYVGISWGGDFGDNADAAMTGDGRAREMALVAGFRLWF